MGLWLSERVGGFLAAGADRSRDLRGMWTTSLSAARSVGPLSVAVTAYRATDWVNYDRLALARASVAADSAESLVGSGLRDYWKRYDGSTRVSLTSTYDLRSDLSLVFSADNLFDRQRGEPDNATIVPGRTLSVGVRAKF